MQDIDFDEIDRAVSSVARPTATPVSMPAPFSEPSIEPTESLAVAAAVPSLAARRSTGRFMDVVHASSDMRPGRADVPFAPTPRREEPIRPVVTERPEPVVAAPSAPAAFQWPDPIEMNETRVVEPVVEPVIEPVVEIPTVQAAPIEEALLSPLESPFLTDTKVEKRPLGAFSTADAELPLLEDFPEPTTSDLLQQPNALDSEELPVDLDAEMIIADEVAPEETLIEAVEIEPPVIAGFSQQESISAGPTSIIQQYTEQPSTSAEVSGSIYDTEAYHQPLVHVPKKRSGVLIAVWVLALVLVGGGIGAALYFVVLPMIG